MVNTKRREIVAIFPHERVPTTFRTISQLSRYFAQ